MTAFPSRLGTHARHLGRMMRCCGVHPTQIGYERLGLGFLAIARICMACGRTQSCRRWLEATAPDGSHEPPAFCPNAERLSRLRSE